MASGGIGGGNLGGVNPINTPAPPPQAPWGTTQQSKGNYYNQQLAAGKNDAEIRTAIETNPQFGSKQSDSDWSTLVQTAGMQSPTGRPLAGSAQFYQPVYQSQYQNYANPYTAFNVSTYGTQPMQSPLSAGGASRENIDKAVGSYIQNHPNADMNTMAAALRGSGMNPYDVQNAGGVNNYSPSAQPQMNWQTGQMTQPTQQPSMFGGQMQGGGYGAYGMNNPFSPYSNSFLNLDQNLNQGTQADKANAYRNAIQNGFGDQQIYNQATGLFGQQSPQAWGYLQGSAMGMTPGLAQGSEQDKIGFYQGARNQGFNDQTIRNAANQMIGNQSQGDWSYLQNRAGYGGGTGGYGNQYMPQMQNPYSYQPTQAATPYQPPVAQRTSSGPSQAIVGRSSQMRGTPNVMRRAEGGIASLMDDE